MELACMVLILADLISLNILSFFTVGGSRYLQNHRPRGLELTMHISLAKLTHAGYHQANYPHSICRGVDTRSRRYHEVFSGGFRGVARGAVAPPFLPSQEM